MLTWRAVGGLCADVRRLGQTLGEPYRQCGQNSLCRAERVPGAEEAPLNDLSQNRTRFTLRDYPVSRMARTGALTKKRR